ncbi:MAG: OB-fold nucleic acid binding domain-containing protein [Phycisphaerales bacterium]
MCNLASRNLDIVRIDADPAGMARPHVEHWESSAAPARGWTRTFVASRCGGSDAVPPQSIRPRTENGMAASPRFVHARGKSVLWMSDAGTGVTMEDARDDARDRCSAGSYRAEPLCAPSVGTAADRVPDPTRFAVPTQPCMRLGLRMVRGLAVEDALRLVDAVARHGSFGSMAELSERAGLSAAPLRRLAAADAFRSMGLDRQQATWQILALRDRGRVLWSFASEARDAADGARRPSHDEASAEAACQPRPSVAQHAADPADDDEPALPRIHELDAIARDLESTGVALSGHPIACIRTKLDRMAVIRCGELRDEGRVPTDSRVSVAGIVLVRQRPSTAKGIVFMTIEDESGIANLIYRPKVYERVRAAVRHSVAVRVEGKVERRHGVVHVLVRSARSIDRLLGQEGGSMASQSRDFH